MVPRVCPACDYVSDDPCGFCPVDGNELVTSVAPAGPGDPLIGTSILPEHPGRPGRYHILRRLGSGGFGNVYLAWHAELEKTVALKIMLAEHKSAAHAWKHAINAFRQDGVANALVEDNPHVVQVLDSGSFEDGGRYLVLEHLRGADLMSLRGDAVASANVTDLVMQACRGLHAVHAVRLIHRDVKPRNLFLHDPSPPTAPGLKRPVVKVIDFGVACRVGRPQPSFAGTPSYMPPEQFLQSEPLEPSADVYALGISMYRLLTGQFPFQVDDPQSVESHKHARMTQEPRSPAEVEPGVVMSSALQAVLMRSIARDRRHRIECMTDFEAALAATPEGQALQSAPGVAYRELDDALSARAAEIDSDEGRTSVLYMGPDGAAPWAPFESKDAVVSVFSDRTIRVSSAFRIHVHGRTPTISHFVPPDTTWSASLRRKTGQESHALSISGGRVVDDAIELDLGAHGLFRAGSRYKRALIAIVAPEVEEAVIVCLV